MPATGVAGCQVLCLCKSNCARIILPPLEVGRHSIKSCWINVQAQERRGSVQADKGRPAQTFPIQGTSAAKYWTNHTHLWRDISILSVNIQRIPTQKEIHVWLKKRLVHKMDAFASDSFWMHTRLLVHAHLSSCGCSRTACANTWLQTHLLCPHLKFWAKWPRYYLHWKTLESTARRMQLKHFPLSKRAERRYAGPRASEAPRGSWRVQEVAMFALSTLPLCPPPSCLPRGFQTAQIPHKRRVISLHFKEGLRLQSHF